MSEEKERKWDIKSVKEEWEEESLFRSEDIHPGFILVLPLTMALTVEGDSADLSCLKCTVRGIDWFSLDSLY